MLSRLLTQLTLNTESRSVLGRTFVRPMANSESVKMGERQRYVPGGATRIGRIRMLWRASLLIVLFFAFCPARLLAQKATTNHDVILRRDPTTSSPALEHLTKGARLTLVDALPDSGFYHVKTEDDRVGWIFAKYVSISTVQTPSSPPTPVTAPPSTVTSTECDSSLSPHVYYPNRLIVKQDCVAITGTIVDATANQSTKEQAGTRHEADGDTLGWLKVDPGFES